MLAKTKKQPEPSLAERINDFQIELEAFIDAKAQALKNSRDGQALFLGDLKHMLTKGQSCRCQAVARILEESGDG
jgi:hypothetical protein